MRVSEILVKRIRVNQGLGVIQLRSVPQRWNKIVHRAFIIFLKKIVVFFLFISCFVLFVFVNTDEFHHVATTNLPRSGRFFQTFLAFAEYGFYLPKVIIQVKNGNGVLKRLVPCLKCIKLAC